LYPERRVFIDILNAYNENILRDAHAISRVEAPGETLDRWQIDYCILSEQSYFGRLARWLAASPEWKLVYWDGASLIYLRNDDKHRSDLNRYGYDHLDPTDPQKGVSPDDRKTYLEEVERGLANPVQSAALYTEAGTLLLSGGYPTLAERLFRTALKMRPFKPRALLGLSQSQYMQGRVGDAIATCRTLLYVSPDKAQVWKLIGMLNAHRGAWREAERALRRSLRITPNDPQTRAALSEAIQKRQQQEGEIP
jgi:tetratricopeptide (TPR) repeat protein